MEWEDKLTREMALMANCYDIKVEKMAYSNMEMADSFFKVRNKLEPNKFLSFKAKRQTMEWTEAGAGDVIEMNKDKQPLQDKKRCLNKFELMEELGKWNHEINYCGGAMQQFNEFGQDSDQFQMILNADGMDKATVRQSCMSKRKKKLSEFELMEEELCKMKRSSSCSSLRQCRMAAMTMKSESRNACIMALYAIDENEVLVEYAQRYCPQLDGGGALQDGNGGWGGQGTALAHR